MTDILQVHTGTPKVDLKSNLQKDFLLPKHTKLLPHTCIGAAKLGRICLCSNI